MEKSNKMQFSLWRKGLQTDSLPMGRKVPKNLRFLCSNIPQKVLLHQQPISQVKGTLDMQQPEAQ